MRGTEKDRRQEYRAALARAKRKLDDAARTAASLENEYQKAHRAAQAAAREVHIAERALETEERRHK